MQRFVIALFLVAITPVYAQQPPANTTYTFTAEQVATLKRAFLAAQFWYNVRTAADANTMTAHGFELQVKELNSLAQDMQRQETEAAKPAQTDGEKK
jgi:hypothetical protein